MPSSYSSRLRLEKQAAGENLNTWGAPKLNTVIDRVDFSIAGISTIALTGAYALTSSNTADDEARSAILKFTGAGPFTVTIPSSSKIYHIWNACTETTTITTGAGTTVAVSATEVVVVFCDGTNVKKIAPTDFGGVRVTGVATPSANTDAANKAYVDAASFNAVNLPAQAGNAGKFVTTDGTTASWAFPVVASISDYASDQATKAAAYAVLDAATLTSAKAFAIAFAVAL